MCFLCECDGAKRSVEDSVRPSVLWGGDVRVCRGRVNEWVMGGVEEKRIGGGWEEQRGWGEVERGCPTSEYMPTCKNTHLHTQESETVFLFWTKCFQEQWEQTINYVRDHVQCIQTVWSFFYHPGGVYFMMMTGWLDRIPLITRLHQLYQFGLLWQEQYFTFYAQIQHLIWLICKCQNEH